MELTPEKLGIYYKEIREITDKFPMMKMKDLNFIELGKHWGYPPLEVLSAAVFLDALHTMNRKSEKGVYIDLSEVKNIKVTRRGNVWAFKIKTKENKHVRIKHTF